MRTLLTGSLSFCIALCISLPGRADDGESLLIPGAGTPQGDQVIYTNNNPNAVFNLPTRPTQFTISRSCQITHIWTYHFNGGKGSAPGTIGLRHNDGTLYGPWQAGGKVGQGNVANAYWGVRPAVTIKPGTYTVVDSNPATWSRNSASAGAGICEVRGIYKSLPPPPPLAFVPNVIGLSHQGALAQLQSAGLRLTYTGVTPTSSALVASQHPAAGVRVARGSAVHVSFTVLVSVPDVVGLTHAQAHLRVEAAGLRLAHEGEPPANLVVRTQYPGSGTRVQRGGPVSVSFETLVYVPNVVGMRADLARERIAQIGLVFVPQAMDASSLADYLVTGQEPNAGKAVARGTRVVVAGEKSMQYIVVPNFVGLEHAAAHLKSQNVGLNLTHEGEPEDDVLIENQEPRAGVKVLAGGTVFVAFRQAPQKVAVPNIVGMDGPTALKALEAVGLRLTPFVGPEYNILTQDPTPGAMVLAKTFVNVTTVLSQAEFSYQGNVVVGGNAVPEYPAELRFVIKRGKLLSGHLYARPLCESNRRQFGAMIRLDPSPASTVSGRWENPNTTITGTYTGDPGVLGCGFGSGQNRNGTFIISMAGGKVIMTTTNLEMNNYIFDASGRTVRRSTSSPFVAGLLQAAAYALGQPPADADAWTEHTFGKIAFRLPAGGSLDKTNSLQQVWRLGSTEKPELTVRIMWQDHFQPITDQMLNVEMKHMKGKTGDALTVYTGLSRTEPPERGYLAVFESKTREERKLALFAYCRADDWLTHQPLVARIVDSIQFDTGAAVRIPRGLLAHVETIEGFTDQYRYFAFPAGAIVTEKKSGRMTHVGLQNTPVETDRVFQPYLATHADKRDQLGRPRSQMRSLFDDHLKVQVFESGTLIQEVVSGSIWMHAGEHRNLPAPRPGQIAFFPLASLRHADYEVIACADRVIVRDLATNLEEFAPVTGLGATISPEMNEVIKKNATFMQRSGAAISPETALFDGMIRVQIFEGGVSICDSDLKRSWQLWHTKRK